MPMPYLCLIGNQTETAYWQGCLPYRSLSILSDTDNRFVDIMADINALHENMYVGTITKNPT